MLAGPMQWRDGVFIMATVYVVPIIFRNAIAPPMASALNMFSTTPRLRVALPSPLSHGTEDTCIRKMHATGSVITNERQWSRPDRRMHHDKLVRPSPIASVSMSLMLLRVLGVAPLIVIAILLAWVLMLRYHTHRRSRMGEREPFLGGDVQMRPWVLAMTCARDPLSADAVQLRIALAQSTDKLDLSDCGLEVVPPEVCKLTNLVELSLSGNEMKRLPEGFGGLTSLRELVLAGNQLTSLPKDIGRLERLEGLFVHGNRLESLPQSLGRLRNLKRLSLNGNCVADLPNSIGDLGRLEELTVGGNLLRKLPVTVGSLGRLKVLHVHGNQLEAIPDVIGHCTALEELHLQGNCLRALPASMGLLQHLTELSVADNRLTALPQELAGLEALGLCYLYGNRLRTLPLGMVRMPALRSLWVEGNPLQVSHLMSVVPQIKNLRVIGLDEQQMAGVLAYYRDHCSACLSTSTLCLGRSTWGGLKRLVVWAIGHCPFAVGFRMGLSRVVVVDKPGASVWGTALFSQNSDCQCAII